MACVLACLCVSAYAGELPGELKQRLENDALADIDARAAEMPVEPLSTRIDFQYGGWLREMGYEFDDPEGRAQGRAHGFSFRDRQRGWEQARQPACSASPSGSRRQATRNEIDLHGFIMRDGRREIPTSAAGSRENSSRCPVTGHFP